VKIRMTRTTKGSPDAEGIRVLAYAAGTEYTVPEALGRAFVDGGVAVEVVDAPVELAAVAVAPGPSETTAADGPSETKPARRSRRGADE